MIEMLEMWFWAYVIGSIGSAVIVFWAIYLVLSAEIRKANAEERAKETPSQRWAKGRH